MAPWSGLKLGIKNNTQLHSSTKKGKIFISSSLCPYLLVINKLCNNFFMRHFQHICL